MNPKTDLELGDELARAGYLFLPGPRMREWLEHCGALDDWPAFAASWNHLGPDPYLARTGRERLRRHAVFAAGPGHDELWREPHQPHFQSADYNRLQGGIERWFEPLCPEVAASTSLRTILDYAHGLFSRLAPATRRWRVEVHQFRIEARPDHAGEPTPEGMHRDGVDYVLVLMIDRVNIARGTTTVHAGGIELGGFTLTRPFDAALVDDRRVFHGVTPVEAVDRARPAYRDVLVVTFRGASAA